MSNRQWTWIILALGFALGGCSGGSGGSSERAPDSLRWAGQPTGKVNLTVVDDFSSPVGPADVSVSKTDGTQLRLRTDASGRATFNFPAGELLVLVSAPDLVGGESVALNAGQTLNLFVRLYPAKSAAGGVGGAAVAPGGVSADGTTLEFTLQLIGSAVVPIELLDGPFLQPCEPDRANDSTAFVADCVAGPAGFDAPYAGAESERALRVEYPPDHALLGYSPSSALLIGQDDQIALLDPGDQRLLAARHFVFYAWSWETSVLLAAFAANDPASGRPSLLPRQPVTLFPTDNPQFTMDGQSYLGTLDTLATMEGGASPLLAAVGQMIDFNAGVTGLLKPALVVISGPGNDCESAVECRSQALELAERSRATGVPVVTVGLHAPGSGDPEVLGLLAGGAAGSAAFWLDDPKQLPNTLKAVRALLHGGPGGSFLQATFRIRSPVPGAFAAGHVVKGQVVVGVCDASGCFEVPVPFVLRIP